MAQLNDPVPLQSAPRALASWYGGELGAAIAELEVAALKSSLLNLFGYHIVQFGYCHGTEFLSASRITHGFLVTAEQHALDVPQVVAHADALPIDSASVDVVVLPHVLEYSDNPHGVLREVERILIPEGYLIVLCFNPRSLFGLRRMLVGWRGQAPWDGRFFGPTRVKDWVTLLGFEIEKLDKASFRPPWSNRKMYDKAIMLEKIGARWWPALGNFYVITACKRVHAVRPLRLAWSRERRLVGGRVAEPTARNGNVS